MIDKKPYRPRAFEFLRSESLQKEWFETLKIGVVDQVAQGSFTPMLHLLAIDTTGWENEELPRYNISVDITEHVRRDRSPHVFRELLDSLRCDYNLFAACVIAPAWTTALENGAQVQEQILFIAETRSVRNFVRLDVAKESDGRSWVTGEKTVHTFDGEAHERFRGMMFGGDAKKEAV